MLSVFLNWSETLIQLNHFKYASDALKKKNNYSGKWMINDETDMNTKPDKEPAVYFILVNWVAVKNYFLAVNKQRQLQL